MSDLTQDNRLDRPVDYKSDHVLGPADAAITLAEYGSYACPALPCGQRADRRSA
ncbi:MAG TPA: hypothetical protein VGL12_00380 [Roseiarcus sp.]